jgi:uncharacterized protein YneF (UPF0154 family)
VGADSYGEDVLVRFHSVRQKIAAVVAAGAIASASVFAPAAHAQVEQVTLTANAVEGLIASYADVKRTSEELKAQYGEPGEGGNDPASDWTAWLAVGGAKGALDSSVQAHGFDNFMSWLQVMTSVAMAYAFVKDGGEMDASMAQAIEQIKNNPSLSAAQKEMMLQQMQASMGAVASIRPSQANIDAVKPYEEQLAAVFD